MMMNEEIQKKQEQENKDRIDIGSVMVFIIILAILCSFIIISFNGMSRDLNSKKMKQLEARILRLENIERNRK